MQAHTDIRSQVAQNSLALYHGTTVIAFLKDEIGWIAADTRVVEETTSTVTSDKKIRETEGIFYAFTINPKVSIGNVEIYTAFSMMEGIIKKEKDLKESFKSFDAAIQSKLNETIAVLQKQSRTDILDKYTKTSFLGFLMVRYKNDKPEYEIRSYKFEKTSTGYRTVIDPPMVLPAGFPMLFLGSYQAALTFLRENKSYLVGFKQMKDRLICLITKEIEANPKYVGYPIDAVEITRTDHSWELGIDKCRIKD